jgi:hypothetical protein
MYVGLKLYSVKLGMAGACCTTREAAAIHAPSAELIDLVGSGYHQEVYEGLGVVGSLTGVYVGYLALDGVDIGQSRSLADEARAV